ncbi:helix-turn-helix domain-containing protein [Spirosoma fluviale]|uniref:Helix-turn-helix domain-containing protein n=1 Tax=Spirosoma fluviale TaxID=1597977 RepID=A0A286GBC0_9BACT|nr:AraC family transcriptional regulator [Spirosoma fluviale]SOD92546.1 Helix-turn-helix domain-containing protein [Spirosoma fluviale]
MKLYIKYMVSMRCKLVVQATLDKLGLDHERIELGEVELKEAITKEQWNELNSALLTVGLELTDNRKAILIERVKTVIIDLVHYASDIPKINNSNYISEKLHYDYTYLANLFSEVTGFTIEKYIINHKIERVKELLLYDELTLTQIANKLNYSSVAHLSAQFKKVTGLTPSLYKQLSFNKRTALEDVGVLTS